MKIFTSGDNVFSCEGVGPEDEEMANNVLTILIMYFINRTMDLQLYILHLKMH